jgi:hypothetical protein
MMPALLLVWWATGVHVGTCALTLVRDAACCYCNVACCRLGFPRQSWSLSAKLEPYSGHSPRPILRYPSRIVNLSYCVACHLRHFCEAGFVVVRTSAGLTSTSPGPFYNYESLIQPPSVDMVEPLSGPTLGGTLVTIMGTQFAGDALVLFVERDATGALTGNSSVCTWRQLGMYSCNDTVIR